MVEKSCSRSHGQPLPGVRNCAMMSSSREISREGVMAHRNLKTIRLRYAARCGLGPAIGGHYPQRLALACGVTARTRSGLECEQAGGVSFGQGGTHMRNKMLTALLIATTTI